MRFINLPPLKWIILMFQDKSLKVWFMVCRHWTFYSKAKNEHYTSIKFVANSRHNNDLKNDGSCVLINAAFKNMNIKFFCNFKSLYYFKEIFLLWLESKNAYGFLIKSLDINDFQWMNKVLYIYDTPSYQDIFWHILWANAEYILAMFILFICFDRHTWEKKCTFRH